MKKVIFALLFLTARVSLGQGTAPYWEPLDGPGLLTLNLVNSKIMSWDSQYVYRYDATSSSWKYSEALGKRRVPSFQPLPAALDLETPIITTILRNDTAYYGFYKGLVAFTSDMGKHWKPIENFGRSTQHDMQSIFELPSGATIIAMRDTLFVSYNAFQVVDTVLLPTQWGRINAGVAYSNDTLIFMDGARNLYHSTDVGKHWDLVTTIKDLSQDTSKRYSWSFNVYPDAGHSHVDVIIAQHQETINLKPVDVLDLLAYSNDGGHSFQKMTTPGTFVNSVVFGDSDRFYATINYGSFGSIDYSYRSDDWGLTWKKIGYRINPILNTGDGLLYARTSDDTLYIRSTDHGRTWDTMRTTGMIKKASSMAVRQNKLFISTNEHTYSSLDRGRTWSLYSTKPGSLGKGLDGSICINTVYYVDSSGTKLVPPRHDHYDRVYEGYGAVTARGDLWLADQGRLMESYDSGKLFYFFSGEVTQYGEPSNDLKNILLLPNDTLIAVYGHAVWKLYDLVTSTKIALPSSAKLTGAVTLDSNGAIYLALSDGSMLVSKDGGSVWQPFISPPITSNTIVTSLAAGLGHILFAVTKDTVALQTLVYRYDTTQQRWSDVSSSIQREGFPPGAPLITNVWYALNYVYVATENFGLFRSVLPANGNASVSRTELSDVVSIWPDPFSNSIVITSQQELSDAIRIIDVTGRTVLQAEAPKQREVSLDCTHLAAGTYFVQTNGWKKSMMIVKQ